MTGLTRTLALTIAAVLLAVPALSQGTDPAKPDPICPIPLPLMVLSQEGCPPGHPTSPVTKMIEAAMGGGMINDAIRSPQHFELLWHFACYRTDAWDDPSQTEAPIMTCQWEPKPPLIPVK